jgi:integrase
VEAWRIGPTSQLAPDTHAPREGRSGARRSLTFKGLRHTVATILAEMGKDAQTIADLLGQRSAAMGAHYSRRADKRRKNTATVADFNVELNRRGTKVVKP